MNTQTVDTNTVDVGLSRSRLRFHLAIGGTVVVVSFIYGLISGLGKQVRPAHAGAALRADFKEAAEYQLSPRLIIPAGVRISPIGQDVMINDRSADALSFVTARPVDSVINEQVARWKDRGFEAVAKTSDRRGVGVGVDPRNGDRHSITAWEVPPTVRKAVSSGEPVQGLIMAMDGNSEAGATAGRQDSALGEIPGIPVKPGGSSGAVFSSKDPGGRSYSGVYTNPGSVAESVEYYREVLGHDGWVESVQNIPLNTDSPVGDLSFMRSSEEVTFVFSPALTNPQAPTQDTGTTTVVVTLVPRPLGSM